MTDITTWAAATAEDGRRTGPEKAVAAHLLDVVKRWRERIADLGRLERQHVEDLIETQTAIDCCAHERAGLEMMLADLCRAIEPDAAVAKPGRTRKPKGAAAAQIAEGLQEALAVARGEEQPHRFHEPADPEMRAAIADAGGLGPDDALVIPAAMDRRAAE